MQPLKTKIFSSIDDVPKEIWNGLLERHSKSFSWEFFQVVEKTGLNDFSYRYILFSDALDKPIGLASFYTVTTDIAIFAPKKLRKLLAFIRQIFPNFLKLQMLECGTPITLNSCPFVAVDKTLENSITHSLDELLTAIAIAEKKLLIVVRDFAPDTEDLQRNFESKSYCIVDNLPNTYTNIEWATPSEYINSLKSYFRAKLLKHLKRAEALGVRHELVEDFAHLSESLCTQWQVVHNNADEFQREILTPAFYREFSSKLGINSKAILFYQDNVLVAHVLLFMDDDLLRWLYFGRSIAANDSIYIYAAHKVIETAILLGAKRLESGLTTYSIKKDLGAQVTSLKLAIKSPSRIIRPLVKIIYPLMNHIPEHKNKDIFKRPVSKKLKADKPA